MSALLGTRSALICSASCVYDVSLDQSFPCCRWARRRRRRNPVMRLTCRHGYIRPNRRHHCLASYNPTSDTWPPRKKPPNACPGMFDSFFRPGSYCVVITGYKWPCSRHCGQWNRAFATCWRSFLFFRARYFGTSEGQIHPNTYTSLNSLD